MQFLTVPNIEDDNQEVCMLSPPFALSCVRAVASLHVASQVWHIPQTGEIFVTYEEYLNRYVQNEKVNSV